MVKAYSKDFRELAIKKMKIEKNAKKVAEEMGIAVRTVNHWMYVERKENRTYPIASKDRKKVEKKCMRKIKDLKMFKDFVDRNKGLSAPALRKKFEEETGIIVSVSTIKLMLKLIGYTCKKKLLSTKSGMKMNVWSIKKSSKTSTVQALSI